MGAFGRPLSTTIPPSKGGGPRTPLWLIGLAVGGPVAMVAVSLLQGRIDPEQMYRDPILAAAKSVPGADPKDFSPLLGFVSNVGVLGWWLAACVSGFAATLVSDPARRRLRYCLAATAGFSALLAVDDMFQAHEKFYPRLLKLDESHTVFLYAIMMLAYLIAFHGIIRRLGLALFIASGATFVVSTLFDLFGGHVESLRIDNAKMVQRLGEDGLKLLGISLWAAYAARLSWLANRRPADSNHP